MLTMNKNLLFLALTLAGAGTAYAQSAIDAYRISQPDLKGTARFMSMAGASELWAATCRLYRKIPPE